MGVCEICNRFVSTSFARSRNHMVKCDQMYLDVFQRVSIFIRLVPDRSIQIKLGQY
jgi:hypothetical protein